MVETILNVIVALLIVISLIFLLAYFQKKRKKLSSLFEIMAYQSLGQKMAIAVIRIDDELLFFGVSQNDFKLLKKIPFKKNIDLEIKDNLEIEDARYND